ncbi:hypothetical protein ACFV0W_36975, partial [Streptomyces anulatus]
PARLWAARRARPPRGARLRAEGPRPPPPASGPRRTRTGRDAATAGRHARDSLTGGNPGGVALLGVLARTMTDGAVEGPGVAVAYGPGFTAAGPYLRAVRSGAAG